jgi:hypothetical protein
MKHSFTENKNNTGPNQTASIKTLLLVFTVAAVSFAGTGKVRRRQTGKSRL